MMDARLMLITTILLPLGGALLLGLLPRRWASRNVVRGGALATTIVTLVLAIGLVAQFPADGDVGAGFAVTSLPWLGDGAAWDIRFHVGLDGLGLWLFALSALLDAHGGSGELGGD